ncbi:MAG: MFS transporter [Myxococcota bacterium]|nr:MFS transporter [Myxococcota bacterium]
MTSPPPEITPRYANYALGLLLGVYIFNFIDRQILSILMEKIKEEIQLSDTELGFLGGIAFALFYTIAGLPIARWADRGSRTNIIAISVLVWSLFTAFTGAARNFWMILVARIGVGIGEAGCSPPAHSLISDFFPPERRGTALSIYALGIPIGGSLGTLVGAWVGQAFGWRTAFVVVGLPGILLSLAVWATLREPVRGRSEARAPVERESESIGEVVRFMAGLRSFWHLSFAGSLHAFVGYGAAYFVPSFFARVHGMGLAERGSWLAAIGLVAVAGTYLGGALGDRLAHRDVRWYMWLPGIATIAGIPIALGYYLSPDPYVALLLFGIPAGIAGPMYLGPTFAMTQTLVKPHMRAVASAILLFILNLIGLGIGPWFVGFVSDALAPRYGNESLRWALVSIVSIGNLWSSVHYFLAARTLARDLTVKDA